ncbi:hypothetical protein [Psychrobacter immobilis]|uniref:hypothetical protein n=1 Tax=Psychrobacter immobilis TaxID=498 RepID=UPI0019180B47|nr:hypothetical protein [Psychrobacter immobilis]
MKIQLLSGLCLLSASLTSCQAEPTTTHYLTPIVTGQVLDKTTEQPISDVSIIYTSSASTTTDKDGFFRLPAIEIKSSSTDDWESKQLSESDMTVYKKDYKSKDYWNFGLPRIKAERASEVPEYVHMGIIYLDKLPDGVQLEDNYKYNEYIEDMSYCQSNQSQKEVNCIPLPDGVDHEAV